MTEDRVRFYSDGIPMSAVLVVDELTPATSRPAFVYSHGWGGAVNAGTRSRRIFKRDGAGTERRHLVHLFPD